MNILVQQVVIPDYRLSFFHLLKASLDDQIKVFAGETDYNITTKTTSLACDHFFKVNNHFYLKRRILWQGGLLSRMVAVDLLVASANMRNLTVVTALFIRKVLRRKTILWGHAQGQTRLGSLLRGFFLRLCTHFVAYTKSQASYLNTQYPWLKVTAAPNACVHEIDCCAIPLPASEVQNVLYVGRLVPEKKPKLLLQGFDIAVKNNSIPESAKLIFIGEGMEKSCLIKEANRLNLTDRVKFLGHISDVNSLRTHYGQAICSVSPGYVGLSATQSFSFGVPMLVAKDEFHSPEIEACKEGFTAEFFESDNPQALSEGLQCFSDTKNLWLSRRADICEWTKSKYTYESMRDVFLNAIKELS